MAETDVLLGVLSARRSTASRPYNEQTTYFRRLIKEGETIGVRVFIFSPAGVRWKRKRIYGWTWTGKRWVRRLYRFPDAVYDRVSPKGKADLSGITGVRNRIRRRGIPLFNVRLGTKWRMHKKFSKNSILKEVLPPTRILTTASLASMMRKYGEVYMKPSLGGQGKGIVWAKRTHKGYVYRIHGRGGSRRGRVGSISALRAKCGRRRYIVQKAIRTLRVNGRSFDVRALVQRLEDGEWQLTGAVARLGAVKSRVTNIHAGGRAMRLEEALSLAGADEETIACVRERIELLALETARCLSGSSLSVGELGVDFAVDTEFNCWLLEANSRTGRISFHRAGLGEIARQADRAPAAYARFLAALKRAKKVKKAKKGDDTHIASAIEGGEEPGGRSSGALLRELAAPSPVID